VKRFLATAEAGVTLWELLLIGFITALFALVGYGMGRTAPATADRTTTLQRLVAILDKTRQEAANAGALVTIAPAGNGSAITVYSGWSTATQLDSYALPVALGLEDTTATTASNTFTFYVRRNGSWYALLGASNPSCADTFLVGIYASSTSVAADGYAMSCAAFAVAPAES
jgi:Tfp pilus assembly protein FimT